MLAYFVLSFIDKDNNLNLYMWFSNYEAQRNCVDAQGIKVSKKTNKIIRRSQEIHFYSSEKHTTWKAVQVIESYKHLKGLPAKTAYSAFVWFVRQW